ncbi:MAG TPA: type 1 glutamine amidotransferase domain-containing protein [Anaerolineales bacterium]
MKLNGKRIAYLVEDGFEDLEFWVPLMRLQEEGAQVTVVGTGSADSYKGKHGLKAKPDVSAEDASPEFFDAVVVPGGWAPDKLRRYPAVLNLVKTIHSQGKIVGAICHAGLVLISAGIVEGRRSTGSKGIKDDLINAGAQWVDEAAFRDGNIVWGRVVEDIPQFCRELVGALADQ